MNRLFVTLIFAALCCCSSGSDNDFYPKGGKTVITEPAAGPGRKVLLVDGEPFFMLGTQIRIDGLTNYTGEPVEILDKYVAAAKELGFTYARIPIQWRNIEPAEDRYDFTFLDKVMSICLKYDMKMELAWFSICMCGESSHCIIPEYVWLDEDRFPRYDADNKYRASRLYGYSTQLVLSAKKLRERETKVVERMMDYIYRWEESHGSPKVIIGVQVYNEADLFLDRGRMYNYVVSEEDAWDDIAASIGQISKVFKEAHYNVATNHNFAKIKGDDVPGRTDISHVRRIFDLDGIDYVAWDPYMKTIFQISQDLGLMKKYIPETIWMVSENSGTYTNTDRLMLSCYAKGCGYNIYDIATPWDYIEKRPDPSTDDGLLDAYTLEDKPHTESVRRMIKALAGTGHIITALHTDDFAAFNMHEEEALAGISQTIRTTTATIGFQTSDGAFGFALAEPEYVTVYVTAPATITLSNGTYSGCQRGRYEKGVWVSEQDIAMRPGFSFDCAENSMYRITVESIDAPQASNADDFKL